MPNRIARSLSESSQLALLHFQDGDTWLDTAARIPRIADGRQRHYHHCFPPLISCGLIEKSGTKQLKGRVVRDDVFRITPLGEAAREVLG